MAILSQTQNKHIKNVHLIYPRYKRGQFEFALYLFLAMLRSLAQCRILQPNPSITEPIYLNPIAVGTECNGVKRKAGRTVKKAPAIAFQITIFKNFKPKLSFYPFL